MTTSRYPSALDDDTNLYRPTNLFQTTLTAAITNSQTTIPVTSTTGAPSNGLLRITLTSDATLVTEFISYTSLTPTSFLGCVRGLDPMFPAVAHAAGDVVAEEVDAQHHEPHTDAIEAIEKTLGRNPQGVFATVSDRLDALGGGGGSGGGSGGIPKYFSANSSPSFQIWKENDAETAFATAGAATNGANFQVFGFTASDVWAGGTNGASVQHWDGTTWSSISLPGAPASGAIYGIWGFASNDLWVLQSYDASVGGDGNLRLFHWNGTVFALAQTIASIVGGTYAAGERVIWGTATNNAVFVANSSVNGPSAYRYNGATWAREASFAPSIANSLSVYGMVNDYWIAVAAGGSPNTGFMYRNTGSGWSLITALGSGTAPFCIWGSSASDIYVGSSDTTVSDLFHWNGSAWSAAPTGLTPSGSFINNVFGLSATDIRFTSASGASSAGIGPPGNTGGLYVRKTSTGWAIEQTQSVSDPSPRFLWAGLTPGGGGGGGGGSSGPGNCNWMDINSSQSLIGCTNYISNSPTQLSLTLPTTAPEGSLVRIAGKGSGGWKILQQAGQQVIWDSRAAPVGATTIGTGGSVTPHDAFDYLEILCINANTTWLATSQKGQFTLT